MKPLVIGLGNDLMGDDAIGILAARSLKEEVSEWADVVESSLHGAALLDILIGYRRAIIIDAIHTGTCPPGTILDIDPDDLGTVVSPSPHFSGLPELKTIARELDLDFPKEVKIVAVEVAETFIVGAPMTPAVAEALGPLVERVKERWEAWQAETPAGST
ncbi:MAG: hydrogenase maturation protease [candidate division Zixibacteria bacterium]|nr:hydrogenase maturation protease [candidate division Zixibacteria bacterium]